MTLEYTAGVIFLPLNIQKLAKTTPCGRHSPTTLNIVSAPPGFNHGHLKVALPQAV